MKIILIEAFIVLAQVLNYTKASQILHTTQPNLSKMIVNLEDEINVRLFTRNKRDVRLTPAGKAFLEDSVKLLDTYYKAIRRAQHIEQGIEGILNVGFIGTALTCRLPLIVNRFRASHPKIILHLTDYTLSHIAAALSEEKIDVALSLDRSLDNIVGLEKKFMFADDMCMIMHKDHPLANEKSVKLSDFRNESFVTMDPKISKPDVKIITDMCSQNGFMPHVEHYANTLQNAMMLVECKVGVTILARHMQRFASEHLKFVTIEGFEGYFKMICAWKKDANPNVDKLLEIIEN